MSGYWKKIVSGFCRARASVGNPYWYLLVFWMLPPLGPSASLAQPIAPLTNPAEPVYNLIALRVSFQPDTSRFTTGDGTFEGALFDTLEAKVDPLPHDAGYFNAHLSFLEHYVERVSDGKTRVNTLLLPQVVQVSQEMAAYSPIGEDAGSDAEQAKLAALVEEAWRLADEQVLFDSSLLEPGPVAFLIFHAGVGRDIELVGTTLDKTPQDLPSLYFNEAALDRLAPGPIFFKGLPVDHTMLIPRTESRPGFDFISDRAFLIEFSINGLLAGSFFNFLGVPDLFNTETGESAIGPFGLMDPLGLFAFNGLFPPEPTAWTRLYLGWSDPVVVERSEEVTSLLAASDESRNEVAIVQVSDGEYFLVENRYRDPEGDGLQMQIWKDGQITTQNVANGDEGFTSLSIEDFEGGVVVAVDNYDWALPGGVDQDGNELNGGLLIWHIDERIIRDGLSSNQVNTRPERRGVDLEEADGAQDIGFPSGNIFAPQSHLGTPFDYYYEGNPVVVLLSSGEEVRLYENRFGADTYPNSSTTLGGPSFVELDGFSLPAATMNFRYVQQPAGGISAFRLPLDAAPPPQGAFLTGNTQNEGTVVAQVGPGTLVRFQNGSNDGTYQSARVSNPVLLALQQIAFLEQAPDGNISVSVWPVESDSATRVVLPLAPGTPVAGPYSRLMDGGGDGQLYALIDLTGGNRLFGVESRLVGEATVSELTNGPWGEPLGLARGLESRVYVLGSSGLFSIDGQVSVPVDLLPEAGISNPVVGIVEDQEYIGFTSSATCQAFMVVPDGELVAMDLSVYTGEECTIFGDPLLYSFNDGTGVNILVQSNEAFWALNEERTLEDDFPVTLPTALVGQPLLSVQEGGDWVLLAAGTDGYLHALDRSGPLNGFPLSVGRGIAGTPLRLENTVFVQSEQGGILAWSIPDLGNGIWSQEGSGPGRDNRVTLQISSTLSRMGDGLMVKEDTYNWPNPIQDGRTFIRVLPREEVRLEVTIIDGAGSLIDRFELDRVSAGVARDIAWQTDAASGIYYARVRAISSTGNEETTIIKMAIVR